VVAKLTFLRKKSKQKIRGIDKTRQLASKH